MKLYASSYDKMASLKERHADAIKYQASVAFYTKRVFKASGSTKMYYSEVKTDPLNRRSLVNFRHYFIVLPKKKDAMAAIMSDYVAPKS